ncbi:MAG TPA: DUF72 domain-containing protein [Gammaproteobacteria bacterium]|nr:DUF72 domain-containing protein [Gammaproteobacteria bacterium]
METGPAQIHIGTSGWHYAHWRGAFYPRELDTGRWLSYYAERLHCTEINNSFYRLPQPAALTRWVEDTPADFLFAIKAWRVITHRKKLKDCADAVGTFLDSIGPLAPKLGPVLFQLPPHWRCNLQRLADFVERLPGDRRYTFEFRDHSWHCRGVYDLLRAYDMAFCVYDLDGFLSPVITAGDFVYIRLHGPGGAYSGKYHGNTLRSWARKAGEWAREGKDVYIFFDNDEAGYAVHNALSLQGMVENP